MVHASLWFGGERQRLGLLRVSGGGSGRGSQGGGGGGRRVQHAAVGRRGAVAHLLRGQVLHALLLVSYREVWGSAEEKKVNYTSAAGFESSSRPTTLTKVDAPTLKNT